MPTIPTEEDFNAVDDEQLRMMTEMPDMMDEALEVNRRQCLPAKPPTRNSSHAMVKAWCDDMAVELRQLSTQWEIDEWTAANGRYLDIIRETHHDLFDDLVFGDLENAIVNARTITL